MEQRFRNRLPEKRPSFERRYGPGRQVFRRNTAGGNVEADMEHQLLNDIPGKKAALRKEIRARAALLTEEYRRRESAGIAERTLAQPVWKEAGIVFLYWSLPSEPDTSPLREAALREGKRVLLPRCLPSGEMAAVPWRPDAPMIPGAFGIPAPAGSPFEGDPDLVVVPCLSAALSGARLGHGKGYYDRYLAAHPGVPTLCLCFRALLSEEIPMDAFDRRMDRVIC